MSDMNTKGMSAQREKLHQERQSRIQQVYKMLAKSDEGLSAKDLSVHMSVTADSIRLYLKELLARDLIYVAAKDGKTRLFKANMSPKNLTEEESKAKIEEALPVSPDGKEFDPGTFVPCGDVCKPGDIVWVSSRSGEGQFFRYLVITPWERKAMVLGIFAEGHPNLNLNDPNYIYLGNDPGTGEGLYADVTNTCQRGYKQFGELLMHVDKDYMDAVKNRLARVMQIDDICGKTIYKEIIKDDPKKDLAIERLKKVVEDKSKHIDEAKELEKDLRQQINGLFMENVDLRTSGKEKDAKIAALKTQMDEMDQIRKDLQKRLEVQCETIDSLTEDNARLRQEMLDTPVAEDEFSETDEKIFAALMSANADLEKDLKQRYEDEIKTLRQIIFSMINKGGDGK